MDDLNFIFKTSNIEIFIQIIKTIIIAILAYYTNFKIINKKFDFNFLGILSIIMVCFSALLSVYVRYKINFYIGIMCLFILISAIFSCYKIGNSLTVTIVSLAINYSIAFVSVIIDYILNTILVINNDYINLIIILMTHFILLMSIIRKKRWKYGITFLKNHIQNEYMDILILNVGIVILSAVIILGVNNLNLVMKMIPIIIIDVIALFITIHKIIQLYYKQKILVNELNDTKLELDKREKEVIQLEQENLNFIKKSHSLAHKQKALEYKLNQLLIKSETAEEIYIKDRLENISKELYNNTAVVELPKTDIPEIDDMLKFMQSECEKNNIDFNLQINENIHYMINNLISKEELEILIADHIKDAIIAIKHTHNVNKSILVRLGKIEECYGLYIFDSGIEFEKETLENLGKKPSTTHADEGGTGIGFMNTFDTLRKHNASLIINEIGAPSKDNFTKVIMIKFDNKNEFKVISYR